LTRVLEVVVVDLCFGDFVAFPPGIALDAPMSKEVAIARVLVTNFQEGLRCN